MLKKTLLMFGVLMAALVGGAGYWAYQRMPNDRQIVAALPLELGTPLGGQAAEAFIGIKAIPREVTMAVVAAEDTRYFVHPGLDPVGFARAMWANLNAREMRQGGSTLTQQVALNLFLRRENSVARKVMEGFLAIELERRYSKARILEAYLNLAYWGHGAQGIKQASHVYFGKPPSALSLAEGALLAGLLRAPEYFTPYRHPKEALALRQAILDNMARYQLASSEAIAKARKTPVRLTGWGRQFPAKVLYP